MSKINQPVAPKMDKQDDEADGPENPKQLGETELAQEDVAAHSTMPGLNQPPRDENQPHVDSEELRHLSNSPPTTNIPIIHVQELSAIPAEPADTLAEAMDTARDSWSLLGSAESGEFELDDDKPMGPTVGQYRYQMTREAYTALSKSLQEKTINTLLHLGEIHKAAYVDSQPPTMRAQIPPRLSQETAESQLFHLDKDLKSTFRRINESKREQAYTLKRINDLEVKIFKRQGADYIRDMLTKVPKHEDLKDLEQIKQIMLERKRLQKEIDKLNMEMSSMNKVMANADVIISECSAIKKPRRVVICHPMPSVSLGGEEFSSRDIIRRGSPNRESGSPPTTTDMTDLIAESVGLPTDPEVPTEKSKTAKGLGENEESNGKPK